MAAVNFTPIQLYHSLSANAVPTAPNLAQGELAININDGKLYYEDNLGVVQVIATKGAGTIGGSTTQIQYNNAGALAGNAAMVFNNSTNVTTLTTLNLTNALGAIYGGTAQSTYAQGDIVYASAANTLAKLGIGTTNYILTSSGSIPQWVAPSSIAVLTATNLDGGAAGSVPYQSGVATTTFLAIGAANRVMTSTGTAPQWVTSLTGLTGVSSSSITDSGLTSGRVTFASTSGLLADSANLTFNGTTLTTAGLSNSGFSTLVKTLTLGNTSFNGTAVFAPTTPAKLYMGTGTVTDVTSAISATNTTGAISSLDITPIAATNTGVTYTNASTLYIAGAPSAGTNVTITNPYSLYVAGGAVYLGGNTAVTGTLSATDAITANADNTGLNTIGAVSDTMLRVNQNGNVNSISQIGLGYSNTYYPAVIYGITTNGAGNTSAALGFATRDVTTDTAPTERMRLDSSGNLGIGTNSPAYRVTSSIASTSTSITSFTDNSIVFTGINTGTATANQLVPILFRCADGTYNANSIITALRESATARNQSFVFAPSNASGDPTERMRLDSSGNLCVGSASAGNAGTINVSVGSPATTTGGLQLWSTTAGTHWVQFGDGASSTDPYRGAVGYIHTSDAMVFWTASTEKMVLSSSGNLTISNGNLIVGTAGKGIDFSATTSGTGTMTSELLADYEEGTWTPAQGSGLTVVGTFSSSGRYTKIGRSVFISGRLSATTSLTTSAGTIMFTNLPFTDAEFTSVGAFTNSAINALGGIGAFSTSAYSTTSLAAADFDFSIAYTV